jgi:hypothetical protein
MKTQIQFQTMVRKIATIVCIPLMLACCDDEESPDPTQTELNDLKHVVQSYASVDKAIQNGYDNEFTGYRAQMGFHYLKASLLDDVFEVKKPEVLMFAPNESGQLKFVGVEYAVPIVDMNNPPPAPEGFTGSQDVWEINTEFKVWTLHVWVGLDNPHGIFAPHNPNLP